MRNKFLQLCYFVLLGWSQHVFPSSSPGKFLDITQAEQRWGTKTFHAEKFRNSSPTERSQMVASALKIVPYKNKSYLEVQKALGKPDGYYFSEYYPAYIIEEGWNKTAGETWQLVFVLDKDRKVKNVIAQKNCCDN